jgi:hypothetical protein
MVTARKNSKSNDRFRDRTGFCAKYWHKNSLIRLLKQVGPHIINKCSVTVLDGSYRSKVLCRRNGGFVFCGETKSVNVGICC